MKLQQLKFGSIFFIFILVFTSVNSYGQSRTHRVKDGETLFSIAHDYQVTIQQLKQWNNLSGSTISIGQALIIKNQSQGETSEATHTVAPNETLFGLAQKYGVSVANLKAWNGLQGSTLKVGTVLTVQPQNEGPPTAAPEPSVQQAAGGESQYIVKSGDTLFRIAQTHNMSVEQLKQLNALTSNNIQVGQELKVQATSTGPSMASIGVESSAQGKFIQYVIKKPQSRATLLETFKMTEAAFKALNPEITTTSFQKGDRVTLLAPPTKTFSNPYRTKTALTTLGTASVSTYRGDKVRSTTSGELYNPGALTAAHSSMAMGSVIFIRNKANQRGVFVRINDRVAGSGLKISQAAWNTLGLTGNNAHVTMFRNNE